MLGYNRKKFKAEEYVIERKIKKIGGLFRRIRSIRGKVNKFQTNASGWSNNSGFFKKPKHQPVRWLRNRLLAGFISKFYVKFFFLKKKKY